MEKTMDHFESYVKRFSIDPNDTESTIFFTTSHGLRHPMSADNVARFLNGYVLSAKETCDEVPDKVTPHMFIKYVVKMQKRMKITNNLKLRL